MMRLSEQFENMPVLSIHAGHTVATTTSQIINPHDLSIAGFYCQPLRKNKQLILLPASIREIGSKGAVIDHEEELAEQADLVRLEEVLKLNFKLADKLVITESKKRLGKVTNFVIDDIGWQIVKLHVQRPSWRAMFNSALIIDRSFIVNVTQKNIVVKDSVINAAEAAPAPIPTPAA